MKHTLKTIIKNVKSIKGNSLAEFATTTALMATLAATAAPKLSEMSEGAKGEKSRNELDKLVKQAGQFYQDTADTEGRGRFPGQERFSVALGAANGQTYDNKDAMTQDDIDEVFTSVLDILASPGKTTSSNNIETQAYILTEAVTAAQGRHKH